MKTIQGLAAVISIFLLVILLICFMVYNSVNNTILSGRYVTGSIEQAGIKNLVADYLLYKAKNLLQEIVVQFNGIKLNDFMQKLADSVDKKWIKVESERTIKGIYEYVTLETNRLPVLDIQPVKNAFLNTVSEELLGRAEIKTALVGIKTAAVMLNGPYKSLVKNGVINGSFLDSMLKKPELRVLGLDRKVLNEAISKYSGVKDIRSDTSDIDKELISGMVADYLEINRINNNLDLNVLVEKAYKNTTNPLTSVRNLVALFKGMGLRIFLVAGFCLLLVPPLVYRKPVGLYRGMAVSGTFCGLAASATGIFGIYSSFIKDRINEAIIASEIGRELDPGSLDILREWLSGMFKGYFEYLLFQGIIVLLATAALFFILGKFGTINKEKSLLKKAAQQTSLYGEMDKKIKTIAQPGKVVNSRKNLILRLVGAYALLVVITLNTCFSVTSFIKNLKNTGNDSGISDSDTVPAEAADFAGALADTLGAGFIIEKD